MKKHKYPRYFVPIKGWVDEIKYVRYIRPTQEFPEIIFVENNRNSNPTGIWDLKSMNRCVKDKIWRESHKAEIVLL